METKNGKALLPISKAQLEVWEWKEKVAAELNQVPAGERMKYIVEKTKDQVKQIQMAQLAKRKGKSPR